MACWLVAVSPFQAVPGPADEVAKSPVQLALKKNLPQAVVEVEPKTAQLAPKNMWKKLQIQQKML